MLLHSVCVLLLLAIGATEHHLIEEEPRARNKAFECVFGKQIKELGSSWVPDLGVPIGILYCMKCECVQFQRKRRIIAKVQCRSIKNKCPEPTCEEPVLLPGKCCKTCQGTNNTFEEVQDVVQPIKEEEKIPKHFAALLTGRSSIELKNDDMQPITPSENKNNVVATGRFTLQRKNLYYSFYISDKAARPRALQFLDKAGNILEEHILSGDVYLNSAYQLGTRKVCGIWRRLPKDYRRMVREETMYVVLIWGVKEDSEFTLSGQIVNNVALGTELFSSLLEPAPGTDSLLMAGAGGTAIISTSSPISPSIHIAIIFNGVFNIGVDILNVPLIVTLSVEDRKQVVVEERIHIAKPAYDLNVLQFSTPVSASDLRQLTRGKLLLSVASVSKPEALKLSGSVITKTTCELFQSTLSSSGSDGNNPYGISGVAWMYLNNEGSLVYNVRIDGFQRMDGDQTKQLTLFDVSPKRTRGGVELEDLTPAFVDGWANGTLEKLGPKVLEPLYAGNLAVNLATPTEGALLRGRLQARLVDEPRNSPAPYLLKRDDSSSVATSAAGTVWLSVAASCHLHYDVSLAGMGGASMANLEMIVEMFPILYPDAPNITLLLIDVGGFSGGNSFSEGSPTETLTKEELRRLDMGFSFLKVRDYRSKKVILSTRVDHLKIPNNCLQGDIDDNTLPRQQPSVIYTESKCLHEQRFYNEDAQWTSSKDPCTMCYCQNGQAKCDTFQCPKLTCEPGHIEIERKDECCSVCQLLNSSTANTAPQVCIFGGKTYTAGATFHPFLIPNGFDRCFKCICDARTLEVNCTRNSEKQAQACCYKNNCPVTIDRPQMYEVPRLPTEAERNMQILHEGGCPNRIPSRAPHKNGSTYHPILDRLGEYKCVLCKCNDGSQSCHRLKCTHDMCNEMEIAKKNGIVGNGKSVNECCPKKVCKKLRRHHRFNRS